MCTRFRESEATKQYIYEAGGPVCVWPDVSEVILVAICMQLLLIIYKVQ